MDSFLTKVTMIDFVFMHNVREMCRKHSLNFLVGRDGRRLIRLLMSLLPPGPTRECIERPTAAVRGLGHSDRLRSGLARCGGTVMIAKATRAVKVWGPRREGTNHGSVEEIHPPFD